MTEEHQLPKLFFFDKVFNKTILPLIPHRVKPNYVTMLRFLMVPWVAFFLWQGNYWIGLILFLIAAFTDAIDGALARTRDQITAWGKMYDPLADKLLICTTVFILVLKYVDFYAAWIIIVLESIIVVAALYKQHSGGEVQSNFWGKLKMILQVVGVVFLLLALVFNLESLLPVSRGTFYVAIAFAIISLFTYSI
ncbi:MAG: CDP-alcohol phosphatidyltransferase family protein [Candidatus Magasanikbacteria bacterium]|nr:CDP-alcohol phosphatidyltransferase family protein [Candidatus Magasanikbacteria bacterium]